MRKLGTAANIISATFGVILFLFPDVNMTVRYVVLSIAVLAILLVLLRKRLFNIISQNWQEILSVLLLSMCLIIIYAQFNKLFLPASIILLTAISVSLIVGHKYFASQTKKVVIRKVSFQEGWVINQWGGKCARIQAEKMVFEGETAPKGTEGSHINFEGLLEIGHSYEITCFVKSEPETTAQFQLWCHDKINGNKEQSEDKTDFKTPANSGETICLKFHAGYNRNLRIHLQYNPGKGKISVSDVKVYKIS